jgi:hypothetical protein
MLVIWAGPVPSAFATQTATLATWRLDPKAMRRPSGEYCGSQKGSRFPATLQPPDVGMVQPSREGEPASLLIDCRIERVAPCQFQPFRRFSVSDMHTPQICSWLTKFNGVYQGGAVRRPGNTPNDPG